MITKSDLLRLHKKLRWSFGKISQHFKLGYWMVWNCAKVNGIRSNLSEKYEANVVLRERALNLYRKGAKLKDISKAVGVGVSTFNYWKSKSGAKRPRGGWKLSLETRRRMSLSRRGKSHWNWKGDILNKNCLECGAVFRDARAPNRRFCSRRCSNAYQIEENHPCWKGGRKGERGGRYMIWVRSILTKSNRACVRCGSRRKVQAHHVRPWARFPESRYDLSNGVALCKRCHVEVHSKKLKPWIIVA